jgi:hypothetical protein
MGADFHELECSTGSAATWLARLAALLVALCRVNLRQRYKLSNREPFRKAAARPVPQKARAPAGRLACVRPIKPGPGRALPSAGAPLITIVLSENPRVATFFVGGPRRVTLNVTHRRAGGAGHEGGERNFEDTIMELNRGPFAFGLRIVFPRGYFSRSEWSLPVRQYQPWPSGGGLRPTAGRLTARVE